MSVGDAQRRPSTSRIDDAPARDGHAPLPTPLTPPPTIIDSTSPSATSESMESEPPSSVRPSAPTVHGDSTNARATPNALPSVVVRTPLPAQSRSNPPSTSVSTLPSSFVSTPMSPRGRTPIDDVVPALSTTTTTGAIPGETPPSAQRSSNGARGLIGARLGRYEIVEELGHGGMATVYRARDPRLGRDVALKVIHHHLRENVEIAERFRQEARAAAKLRHPAIVEIFDVPDEEAGERFLVAELVEGPSLRRWLVDRDKAKVPPMPPEVAAAIVLEILDGLAKAHDEGIIHRDVKPENILLTRPPGQPLENANRPAVKLTDFGIAKILDSQGVTATGQILGSPAHMAPEQIEAGEITARVDVFAAGVLFYELCTATLPFDGKNPAQVIRRVLDGDMTPADRVLPTIGGRWSAILAAMLARDPKNRPASAPDATAPIAAELAALQVSGPRAWLADYLRDPAATSERLTAALKPRLVERAAEARLAGDAVGAAHDLNRAIAYDPNDIKLVRAVAQLQSRARRARRMKRAAPIVGIAIFVAIAAIFAGRFLSARTTERRSIVEAASSIAPSTARTITPSGALISPSQSSSSPSAQSSFVSSTQPSSLQLVVASASVASSRPTTASPNIVASTSASAHAMRRVRFNLRPESSTFKLDGEGPFDSFAFGERALSVGDHAIIASGVRGCCAQFVENIRVMPGDDTQVVTIKLALNPVRIYVTASAKSVGLDPAMVTVTVRTKAGDQLARGRAPLDVKVSETSVPASIVLEANGYPSKTVDVTLVPGNASYVEL